uniref:Deoxyribonuclease I-like 1-like n=1 Tax=Cyprinus carpio TaxID=7962 RepID=A0A8C1UET5_CYPCA
MGRRKKKPCYEFCARLTETSHGTCILLLFSRWSDLVKYFALIGQHTCPKIAMKEMEALYEVFQKVRKKWKTENVMFLGDLNAACSYVTNKGLKNVCLRSDPKFHWLIRDEHSDTTVCEKTCCTYDKLISGIVPESEEVHDHYPVEVDLKANHRYLLRHEL